MNRAYFDYNASCPPPPEVIAVVQNALQRFGGNPGSPHADGVAARVALEEARETVAAFLGAQPRELFFTSGGSEAINWAIKGTVLAHRGKPGSLLTGSVEHESVRAACEQMQASLGWRIHTLPCDERGHYLWGGLERMGDDCALTSLQLANSETGVLQDLTPMREWCETNRVPLHMDAIQAVGRIRVHVAELGADMLSLAGHKLGAPKGVGALVIRGMADPAPLLSGGGQERGKRAGTENLPGILGLAAAAKLAIEGLEERSRLLRERTRALWQRIRSAIPGVLRNGDAERAVPGVLNFAIPGCDAEALIIALDLAGLSLSAGPACSSGALEPSPTLAAMGLPAERVRASIRLAVHERTSEEDLEQLLEELKKAVALQR